MTTTTTEATRFTVGLRLYSHEVIDALPVGTVIRPWRDVNSMTYTREAAGWVCAAFPEPRDGGFLSLDGYNEVVSLPDQPYPVGTAITSQAMWEALPNGTRICMREPSEDHWVIEGEQIVLIENGATNLLRNARTDGELVIEGYPGSDAEPTETLTRYKQRFRTVTFGAAQAASITMGPVERAMIALGVPNFEPCPGMVFDARDERLKDRFTPGTVVEFGTDPSDLAAWSLYGYSREGWTRLLGQRSFEREGVIRSMPGVRAAGWVMEPADMGSVGQILAFKQAAWRLGVKAKADNNWCGEYESAMQQLGINETIVRTSS